MNILIMTYWLLRWEGIMGATTVNNEPAQGLESHVYSVENVAFILDVSEVETFPVLA